MTDSRLKEIKKLGQSVWLDYLSKDILDSGYLARLMSEDGVSGVTSNPSIFQNAMQDTDIYDERIRSLVEDGVDDKKELFLGLALEDIRQAADLLLPEYRESGGRDGFVSIEVSPDLAYDTGESISEAKRLFLAAGRENVMVKIPGTKEGLAAIERLIADGVNINVTLLFSVERYAEVAEAYMAGLEKRAENGLPVNDIASVASFFISRIDTLVDGMLEDKAKEDSDAVAKDMLKLRGTAGISSGRLAYKKYKEIIASDRFAELEERGARPQKLLWGSTSVKDPAYRETMYVEELIGPDTINTVPEKTLDAFRDSGVARLTLDKDPEGAVRIFKELGAVGIEMEKVAEQLVEEGVRKFSDSFFDAMDKLSERRDTLAKKKAA